MSEAFYQYETLPLDIVLVGDDGQVAEGALDDAAQVVVSIDQPETAHVDYTGDALAIDPETSTITLTMPQQDTALFERARVGRCCNTKARIQVNILYLDGRRLATTEGELEVFDNLYRRVMA